MVDANAAPEHSNAEGDLLQKLALGDDSALGQLYDRLSRPLFSLALQILRDDVPK